MPNPNVLILIPPGRQPRQAMRAAVDLARERGSALIALVVIDPDAAARVTSRFSEVGFMSEHTENQVSTTILRELRAQAEASLRTLAEHATKDGVAVTPLLEEGDTEDICRRVIRTHQIGVAVLVAEKRSWLTRFLARSAAVNLPTLAGCEVRVMEED
jgi:nucleotide-binding universal stress UspA family protein